MNTYKLKIDEEALQDIQNATDWYNEQLEGLGTRFQKQVKNTNQFPQKRGCFSRQPLRRCALHAY
jgi:hypothetical protein